MFAAKPKVALAGCFGCRESGHDVAGYEFTAAQCNGALDLARPVETGLGSHEQLLRCVVVW
jgi:hypothetical protein